MTNESSDEVVSLERMKSCRAIATVTLVTVVVAFVVLIALSLAVFRPRDPTFTIYLVGLRDVAVADLLRSKNLITRGVVIGVRNENYGSVSWQNFTVLVEMRERKRRRRRDTDDGATVGKISIPEGIIAQRSTMNITTNATLQLDRLEGDLEDVAVDLLNGGLNFTCSVTALARIRPFNVLPSIRGSISVDCFASLYINKHLFPGLGAFGGQAWCWMVKKRVLM